MRSYFVAAVALCAFASSTVFAQAAAGEPLCPRGEYWMEGSVIHAKVRLPSAGYTVKLERKHMVREMPPHFVCIPPVGSAAQAVTEYNTSLKVSSSMKSVVDAKGTLKIK